MMQARPLKPCPSWAEHAPTLLAEAAPTGGAAYNNDHPVGINAIVSCGGGYNWDCTGGGNGGTQITMTGPASQSS